MVKEEHIICCDWGTSSFRLRIVAAFNGEMKADSSTNEGVSVIHQNWLACNSTIGKEDFFLQHLNKRIADILDSLDDIPAIAAVVISGMASSSIGLMELPYAETPFSLTGQQAIWHKIEPGEKISYPVWIMSGLRSQDEVMRGEETQLIGISEILQQLSQDTIICVFPGTHSKHVRISKGIVIGFQTYITGELFQVLSRHSVLSNSVSVGAGVDKLTDSENQAFVQGVSDSAKNNLLNTVFAVRTNQLFSRMNKTDNAFYLSGLLIGTELQTLKGEIQTPIVIACGQAMYPLYKEALTVLGLEKYATLLLPQTVESAAMLGQLKLFTNLFKSMQP